MNFVGFNVLVVVLWSVEFFTWVNKWVHVNGCAINIEIEDVEKVELFE